MRCSMTGRELNDPSEGVYDDGEWISWEWIYTQLHEQELAAEFPKASIELIQLFEGFVDVARDYKMVTGKYLQVWGELGELYAEIKFGIRRHRPHAQGSDGRLGNDFVEVKTISPEKGGEKVMVKRAGNFNKLLIVKISEDFEFDAKLIDRRELTKGKGKKASVSWRRVRNQTT